MFNIGDVLTRENYTQGAEWANSNNAEINLINGEYIIVAKSQQSAELLQQEVRIIRDLYLTETDKTMLVDFPISEEEREKYKAYRKYLRDYTENNNWWLANPKTFEEWNTPKISYESYSI